MNCVNYKKFVHELNKATKYNLLQTKSTVLN